MRNWPHGFCSKRGDPMAAINSGRAHLIAGGFPPGSMSGHDHDYARLKLLGLLAERDIPASVANDFADVEKWLPVSRLLITYTAGPYPDAAQTRAMRQWVEAGGHWLGLHGTSGGRAERVDGMRNRRTVKTEHHALLGSKFLTHPPICKIHVEVTDAGSLLTQGLGAAFDVEDEPYFVELQDPASARILLTADYGASGEWPVVRELYGSDTSLQADGRTRVLGYSREVGNGGVTYIALGHCHNPAIRAGRTTDPADTTPPIFHGAWESGAFTRLLRNAIAWGVDG
jgi:type 1 glutamine amidotransferase